jgi:hypothetical protein
LTPYKYHLDIIPKTGARAMDEKLAKTLASADFEAWRLKLWKEISTQAIGEGWVPIYEIGADGIINHNLERWSLLWETLVCDLHATSPRGL